MARFPKWIRDKLHHHDTRNTERALGPETEHVTNPHIPSAGQLRGIPAVGRGVTGAIPGSRPEDAIR
jgi:hypothetical protein